MKGRMKNEHRSNGGGCYATGGAVKERDIGGVQAPSYGVVTPMMKKAIDEKTNGMVEDGISGKARLDRPGRKHGGSVHHAKKKVEHKAGGGLAGGSRTYADDKYDRDMDKTDDDGYARASMAIDRMAPIGSGAAAAAGKLGKMLAEKTLPDMSSYARENGGRAPMKLDLKEGALHKELGVSEDKKIPAKKLEKAAHSDNPLLKKRAVFAENAKHWNHGKKD